MKFINQTSLPAVLVRSGLDERRLAAALIARATFDMVGGEPRLSDEQRWQVSTAPIETPYGTMDGEVPLRREGVDIFLFGTARAPGGRPVTSLEVGLDIGAFSRKLQVTGRRVWQSHSDEGTLEVSAPEPFANMPLTLEHAYGGILAWDGLHLNHPDNPNGVGFYASREEALGKALPNIEEADQCVQRWEDRPLTAGVGFCAMNTQQRLAGALTLDDNGLPKRIERRWLNAAYPRMIAAGVRPEELVRMVGLNALGPLEWRLPSMLPRAVLIFGKERIEVPLHIDQLGLEVDARRMFVSYRHAFRYVLYPEQHRSCELVL